MSQNQLLAVFICYAALTYSLTHDTRKIQPQQWNRFMLTAWSDFLTTQYRQNLHITGTLKKQNSTTKNTFYATKKQTHRNNNDKVLRTTVLLSYCILLCYCRGEEKSIDLSYYEATDAK
jgi:hypothetical protein